MLNETQMIGKQEKKHAYPILNQFLDIKRVERPRLGYSEIGNWFVSAVWTGSLVFAR